jgi:hypothetical protein
VTATDAGAADEPQTGAATVDEMKRSLSCECGFEITASEMQDLLEAARHHARQAHRMTLSAEHLRALEMESDEKPAEATEIRTPSEHGGR